MIIQLFIFGLLALGFGLFAFFRKKRFIGVTFVLMGAMLLAVAAITVYLYPQSWPF